MIETRQLLKHCLRGAMGGSQIIRSFLHSEAIKAVEKADAYDEASGNIVQDLQTEADRQTEVFITNELTRAFPGIKIIGEESTDNSNLVADLRECVVPDVTEEELSMLLGSAPSHVALTDLTVYVDPLDGTNAFTKGKVDFVTCLVGVSLKEHAFLGIVIKPFDDHPKPMGYVGVVGGCVAEVYHQDGSDRVRLEKFTPPKPFSLDSHPNGGIRAVVHTDTRLTPYMVRVMNRLDALQNPQPAVERISMGGAGRKMLAVLLGEAQVFINPRAGTKRWDSCAGEAVLEAAGLSVTDALGEKIVYGKLGDGTAECREILNATGMTVSVGDATWHEKWAVVPHLAEARDTLKSHPEESKWFDLWLSKL